MDIFFFLNEQYYIESNSVIKIIVIFHLAFRAEMTSGRRGRDRMVVGFTTTGAISAYHH
jgi:hypothetical protein